MLLPMIVVELVLMFAVPFALGWLLRRRLGVRWALFGIGAATFVISQVFHIPFNAGLTTLFRQGTLPEPLARWQLPVNAAILGLSAGVFEEVARYLVYRFWATDARTWRRALMLGTGHGGIESVLTGVLVGVTVANMAFLQSADLEALGLSPEQSTQTQEAVAAFWDTQPYMPLLAAAERLMSMLMHLSLSSLVVVVFVKGKLWSLFAAIGWHAIVNAAGVFANGAWGALAAEGVLFVASLGSGLVLWWTWRILREPALQEH
jgi:uncharacterized membrane protein YhfC